MKTFAILFEPATYTTDRNRAVYDPLGVDYEYINGTSLAATEAGKVAQPLSELGINALARRIWQRLKEYDTIIINGYNHRYFVVAFLLNIFWGRRLGIDSDTPLSIPQNRLKRWMKGIYLNLIFRNRHAYGLAGGTKSHKELFRHYGMAEERIFLMPMMVDNERFYYQRGKVKKDEFTFLYVGRIVECKNINTLLKAFSHRFKNSGNVQLNIVGDGELLTAFKKEYKDVNNIRFMGKLFGKELTAQYHEADVFVLPSSYEPWGLVVNEAMCASLPVIVSDLVGAAYDMVEGHDTGCVFRYDNAEELAQCMLRLYEDSEFWKRCSDNAFHRMHDYWNYTLYRECLKKFINE